MAEYSLYAGRLPASVVAYLLPSSFRQGAVVAAAAAAAAAAATTITTAKPV